MESLRQNGFKPSEISVKIGSGDFPGVSQINLPQFDVAVVSNA